MESRTLVTFDVRENGDVWIRPGRNVRMGSNELVPLLAGMLTEAMREYVAERDGIRR